MCDVEKKFLLRGLKVADEPKYQLLKYAQVAEEVEKVAKDAAKIIEFSVENSKILLHHFKWDAMNMTEKFYEAHSPKAFLQKNNIILIDEVSHDATVERCHQCDEIKEVIHLQCSHSMCMECWKMLVVAEYNVAENKESIPMLTCPADECKTPIPETFILQLFNDADQIYQELIVNSFITLQSDFKWCPNRKNGCDNAVKIESDSKVEEITCECGFTFCFSCEDIPHSPIPCLSMQEFYAASSHSTVENIKIQCDHCKNKFKFHIGLPGQTCNRCGRLYAITTTDILQNYHIVLSPIEKEYLEQNDLLKMEYGHLRDFEDVANKFNFVKTAMKTLHNFRQKYINFLVFSFFLDTSRITDFVFDSNVKKLGVLIDNATDALNFPNWKSDKYFDDKKQQVVLEPLELIKLRLCALTKSYEEEDWDSVDHKLQKSLAKKVDWDSVAEELQKPLSQKEDWIFFDEELPYILLIFTLVKNEES